MASLTTLVMSGSSRCEAAAMRESMLLATAWVAMAAGSKAQHYGVVQARTWLWYQSKGSETSGRFHNKSPLGMGTLCTGKRAPIYGHGDTLQWQKGPHIWA